MDTKLDEIGKELISVIERFLQVVREKNMSGKPAINFTTDIYDDLEIDSLEAMDLMAEIEKDFNISVNAEELMAKRKVGEIADYISKIKLSKS